MDGGHQAIADPKVILQDLGHGSQAVGGAGGVAHHRHIGGIAVLIDAHDEHGSVLGGRRDNDLFRAGLPMCAGLLDGLELAGGFDDIFHAKLLPGVVLRGLAGEDADGVSVDDDRILSVGNGEIRTAVDGVVGQHISQIFGSRPVTVHRHKLQIVSLHALPQDQTADAAKSVDTNFCRHECCLHVFVFF